ncbi:hypothetical protein BpHYR1_043979 [Brachionus plicatilis]|uniref:Uncharacterized protein n=1 Tax=Brachionus plicatilis TaxID=10195 RepID=A0A3M7RQS8_BRAPC|nr:hypothetical protein BpHYR1_043979 [Brachionus plicatilis]
MIYFILISILQKELSIFASDSIKNISSFYLYHSSILIQTDERPIHIKPNSYSEKLLFWSLIDFESAKREKFISCHLIPTMAFDSNTNGIFMQSFTYFMNGRLHCTKLNLKKRERLCVDFAQCKKL